MNFVFRRNASIPVILALGNIVLLTMWGGLAHPAWADQPVSDLRAGQLAYEQHCARCHGDQGRGDGLDAKRFYPRPRDFSLGIYKFRSTASGTPPTDDDLFRTITQGLPGSNMPDWQHLDEATRWQIVSYLKSLAPVFQQTKPESVTVAPDPGPAHADLAKGRQVYDQLGCAACHGPHGRANGPSAAGLMDDWGKPIRPANLAKGWSYRGGSDARSVMLRVLAGIDGTGMPSYAGAVSTEDAWQLAYYVTSLQEPPHWNLIAHAAYVSGALPTTLDDPRWALAERTDVRVRNVVRASGEWADSPMVSSVTFQALYNDEAMAFRVTWDDPTQDPPARAEQREADGPAPQAGLQASPDRVALLLRTPSAQGDIVSLQAWPYAGAPQLDLCYWSADTGQTVEALAGDFESVIQRQGPHVPVSSFSSYEDGRWHLVLQRALRPASPAGGAAITEGIFTPVAFALWDGSNPGARAVSTWVDVVLRRAPR